MTDQLKELYRQVYELTKSKCTNRSGKDNSCGRCCSPASCIDSVTVARSFGIGISDPPMGHTFVVDGACSLEPWERPLCTIHHCEIFGRGGFYNDPTGEDTARYFELRNLISETHEEEEFGHVPSEHD